MSLLAFENLFPIAQVIAIFRKVSRINLLIYSNINFQNPLQFLFRSFRFSSWLIQKIFKITQGITDIVVVVTPRIFEENRLCREQIFKKKEDRKKTRRSRAGERVCALPLGSLSWNASVATDVSSCWHCDIVMSSRACTSFFLFLLPCPAIPTRIPARIVSALRQTRGPRSTFSPTHIYKPIVRD